MFGRYYEEEETREPASSAMDWATCLGWMVLGAGIMYLLDPTGGGRRRSFVRDKFARGYHSTADAARGAAIMARDHARGYAHEAKARLTEGPVEDHILAERVRSQMGRAVTHPGSIDISAHEGCITLRGPILAHEVDNLLRNVRSVRGVQDVRNELSIHETAGSVPGLQGAGSRQSGG